MSASTRTRLDALPSAELARRLAELAGEERQTQVDFLLHLEAFDRLRGWQEAGYASLWAYCREALLLREGAASRRIGAMRVLRRLPELEPALREGRLCLSTAILLGPVLTTENADDLVARAAFLSKAETERLVATLQPRIAPREGIRLLPGGPRGSPELALVTAADATHGHEVAPPEAVASPDVASGAGVMTHPGAGRGGAPVPVPPAGPGDNPGAVPGAASRDLPPSPGAPPAQRHDLRPIDGLSYSLRVTLGAQAKADLDALVDLLSHKTGRDLAGVVHEAIRCALAMHGKRRGAVPPARPRRAAAPKGSEAATGKAPARGASTAPALAVNQPMDPRALPAEVRRQVWARDGGRCTYVSPEGRRCGSRWKLELHHREPAARGGAPTVENITLRCKPHNLLEGDRAFGPAHMARFTRRDPSAKEDVAPYGTGARLLALGRAP